MIHHGTHMIWTAKRHICLRQFSKEDARAMFDNWASDREVTKYLTWDAYNDIWGVSGKIEEWVSEYRSDPLFYHWAIEFEGELVGSISADTGKSASTDRAELGYCIGRKWWNFGLTTEAAKAVISYMFSECGAHSCGIEHSVNNPASGRVAEKCGMHCDGVIPEYFRADDGSWQDIEMWSILDNEWREQNGR